MNLNLVDKGADKLFEAFGLTEARNTQLADAVVTAIRKHMENNTTIADCIDEVSQAANNIQELALANMYVGRGIAELKLLKGKPPLTKEELMTKLNKKIQKFLRKHGHDAKVITKTGTLGDLPDAMKDILGSAYKDNKENLKRKSDEN